MLLASLLSDLIMTQPACTLSDVIICLHSGITIDIKRQNRLLKFVMCPLLAQLIIGFFFLFYAAAVYSTNEANKAGGMRH
jgi:hypothetical protein